MNTVQSSCIDVTVSCD